MPEIADGETVEMQGSAKLPYQLTNRGGVYSCSCPAWRNQSIGIERRTCKHLQKYRGKEAEQERLGSVLPARPVNEDGETSSDAPPLLLAHTWDNETDLSGWWMSEKLDGVRAYWDGKQFLSRQGNLYHAPDWFCECLPETPLDGELWLDRKAFQRTVSIVRRQDKSEHWREISFLAFDAPAAGGGFEERQKALTDIIKRCESKQVQLLEQQLCRDLDHLRGELQRVEELGGEGLMLREPGSAYEAGRSTTLYKIKSFHDAEAVVVDHLAGEGRHRGRLGALAVKLPNGIQFAVGTGFSDAQRGNPPAVGSTITFRYQELSDRGVPRFPSFVRVRNDVSPVTSSSKEIMSKAKKSKATAAPPKTASSKAAPPAKASAAAPATKTKAAAAPAQSSGGGGSKEPRYFEFVEGGSSKFWEIARDGLSCTVRYGRIGAAGTVQTKTFPNDAAVQKHYDKLVEEKTGKGYVETKAK